jgi:hopanoid biosynthesis associated RND transporter like protein HpnN
LLLCAFTTAAAFFAFIPTAYSGVGELGLIAGTGMFISLVASVTFLPALIDILRPPRRLRKRMPAPIPELLAQLPLRHGVAVRLLALSLGVTALAVLPQARFDYDPINLRDAASESVATFKDLMAESTTSPLSLVVLAPDEAHAALYVKRLSELDVVDDAVSLQSFIPDDQEEKLAIIQDIVLILGSEIDGTPSQTRPTVNEQRAAIRDTLGVIDTYLKAPGTPLWRAAVERLRDTLHALLDNLQISEQAAQTQLMSRVDNNLLGSLPESLDRLKLSLQAGPVQAQDLPSDLVQRWVSKGGIYRIEVYPKEDLSDIKALRRFVSAVRSAAPDATGEPILMLESGNAIVTTFQRAFGIALLVISMVLLIEMRSAADTVLVLVPLIFGALLTGAALVILQIPFNFANIIALPLLLGIGVDNGIHMIRRMRSTAMSQADLLRSSTARAMVFSALTTICSFGNLSFSSHPGTASMGQILTIGVSLTLLATLIVLPALLEFASAPSRLGHDRTIWGRVMSSRFLSAMRRRAAGK